MALFPFELSSLKLSAALLLFSASLPRGAIGVLRDEIQPLALGIGGGREDLALAAIGSGRSGGGGGGGGGGGFCGGGGGEGEGGVKVLLV